MQWIYRPVIEKGWCNRLLIALKWLPGTLALIPAIILSPPFSGHTEGRPDADDGSNDRRWRYPEPRHLQRTRYTDIALSHNRSASSTEEALPLENDPPYSDVEGQQPVGLRPVEPRASTPTRNSPAYDNVAPTRLVDPRFICVLDGTGYKTMSTDEARNIEGSNGVLDYVFVSYTRKQFNTSIKGDDASKPATEEDSAKLTAQERDREIIQQYAMRATKDAKKKAFWIDFECVRPESGKSKEDSMEDVYRICDTVRTAHSLAIVTGPHTSATGNTAPTMQSDWLKEWGSRLWTVPEALLAPTEHRIFIYTVGNEVPQKVAKRNLSQLVWDDAPSMQMLIEHYENSLRLEPLEFVTLAHDCLQRRETQQRNKGDVAYALMGLLRERPRVPNDSAFEAFARVLLANGSKVLERMVCLKPNRQDAQWYHTSDQWNASIKQIEPLCTVTKLAAGKDLIAINNVPGAVINWSFLEPVDYVAIRAYPNTWLMIKHFPGGVRLQFFTICILMALLDLLGVLFRKSPDDDNWAKFYILLLPASLLLVICFLGSLACPYLIRSSSRRDISRTQARFFGVEGVPCLDEIEEILLGSARGRLSWEPQEPLANYQEPPQNTQDDSRHLRQFTLIDSRTLTAVTFSAVSPPNAIFACGHDGRFVRSVLCSYEKHSGIFTKVATLRMQFDVQKYMPIVEQISFHHGYAEPKPDGQSEAHQEGGAGVVTTEPPAIHVDTDV